MEAICHLISGPAGPLNGAFERKDKDATWARFRHVDRASLPRLMSPVQGIKINMYIKAPSPSTSLPTSSENPLSAPLSRFIVRSIVMPLVQTRPRGRIVRFTMFPFTVVKLTRNKTRTFVEGYHFGPLWSRRRVVHFDVDVPANESSSNLRYVDMKSSYSRTGTSRRVHESRVYIGQDMFLVSGYWDPKADQ